MYGNRSAMLLDTDIFINYLRGQEEEAAFFRRVFVEKEFTGCYSSITELELFAVERMTKEQEAAIDNMLNNLQRVDTNSEVARLAGRLLAKYRKPKGLEMPDAIIAASAIFQGASLVTKNTKHYSFIPGLVLSPPSAYTI